MYPLAGYIDTLEVTNPKDCPYCFPNNLCTFHQVEEEKIVAVGSSLSYTNEGWVLVERYVKKFPDDFRLVFKKSDRVLELQVPKEIWYAFEWTEPKSFSMYEVDIHARMPEKDYGDEGCGEKGEEYGRQTS
jgi:hypothetical protein